MYYTSCSVHTPQHQHLHRKYSLRNVNGWMLTRSSDSEVHRCRVSLVSNGSQTVRSEETPSAQHHHHGEYCALLVYIPVQRFLPVICSLRPAGSVLFEISRDSSPIHLVESQEARSQTTLCYGTQSSSDQVKRSSMSLNQPLTDKIHKLRRHSL